MRKISKLIAGVRAKQIDADQQLHGVIEAIAIDDDAEIDKLGLLGCVADTIGGKLSGKLLARVKHGGTFGCFPSNPLLADVALHPTIHSNSVFSQVAFQPKPPGSIPGSSSRSNMKFIQGTRSKPFQADVRSSLCLSGLMIS